MGGGGDYYSRDVTSSTRILAGVGYTDFAKQTVSRREVSKDLLPKGRILNSNCKSPLVYGFDDTGSMGDLPLIICDKWPMVAGQIAMQRYLDDPMVSLAAVGDIKSDSAPLQVCDFATIKDLDPWLQKLWVERNGGEQHFESYEFLAYFYARCYDMQNAEMPICLFTGDESFRESLSADSLRKHFGGQHENVNAREIFRELKNKFKGNVFLIHRYYALYGLDAEIVVQWESALGNENVITLVSDVAIADVTLGVIAIASGARTLDEYIEDIKNRPLEMGGQKYEPQSPDRIAEVRNSLQRFAESRVSQTVEEVPRSEDISGDEAASTPLPEKKGKLKKL